MRGDPEWCCGSAAVSSPDRSILAEQQRPGSIVVAPLPAYDVPEPEVPAWLPPPDAPMPASHVPGDIGAQLARELGIEIDLDPIEAAAPSVDDSAETPQWRALLDELGPPDGPPAP